MKRYFLTAIIVTFFVNTLCACGRYEPPVPPEALGPERVRDLIVTAEADGILFSFRSAEKDARGKPLKSLDEYRIYRKELSEEDNSLFNRKGYILVTAIKDRHLPELFKLQDEARKVGKSPRRVAVPDNLVTFSYKDSELTAGSQYAYRITGVNQNDVESDAERVINVLFDGNESEILIIL